VKTVSLKPFIYKMMILPRQARDKHRENSKPERFFQVQREQEQQEKWEAEVLLLETTLLSV
jgi:hypothetical protein